MQGAVARGLALAAVLAHCACASPGGFGDELAPGPEEPAVAAEETAPEQEAPLEEDWFDEFFEDPAERDPWEPVNRRIFGFNEIVYDWVLDPVATIYDLLLPDPGQRAVQRFFLNLSEPVVFVNDVFQLAPRHAGSTGARFLINSTVGLVGLFDPAAGWGFPHRHTDFGQTLAVYRVGAGPYLVIPVFGPSTARDVFGELVDALLRPDVWLLTLGPIMVVAASDGIVTYDLERERLQALRDTSVDFYSALRGAYLLDRDASVDARRQAVRD